MSIKVTNTFNSQIPISRIRAAIGLLADTEVKRMEAEAKTNAPWMDITGNARNSIQGNFNWQGTKAAMQLSGNMEYFVYLELAKEKRYAILKPTIDKNASRILSSFQKLVK